MLFILCPQNEGVKIFIQLYKEFEPALSLGSEFAQNVLKHPNIVVSCWAQNMINSHQNL